MREPEQDVSVAAYEAAERRLKAWGEEYRRISEAVRGPVVDDEPTAKQRRIASWRDTIARVLGREPAEDQRWKRSRRECLDCGHKADPHRWGAFVGSRRRGKRVSWSSDACPKCGSTSYRVAALTARGRQTRSGGAGIPVAQLSTEALRTEALLARLSTDDRDVIARKYRIGQPDHEACRELRVRKGVYQLWVQAAVAQFVLLLLESEKVDMPK